MTKQNRSSQKTIIEGTDSADITSDGKIQNELSEALKKLEHRVEILTSISREQEIYGYYELAEAYQRQADESQAYVQSIRKMLKLDQEGGGLK